MKVLVIGGSGFIGTRLIGELLAAGHQVVNFDLRPSEQYPELTVVGDVREAAAVDAAAAGCEAVMLLAAEHRDDVQPVSRYESVNVDGAGVVARVATAAGIDRIVFTSTVAVYGLDKVLPDETTVPEPFNPYGRTKLAAEKVLGDWAAADPGRSLAVVRPTVVFGEGNRGNVYTLIRQMTSRMFVMIGNGRNRKSMAYVGNVAEFLAGRLAAGPGVTLVNYADKPDLTVAALVALVRRHVGGRSLLPFALPYPVGLLIGMGFDLVARVTGKQLPISAVRVRKFCSETSIATDRLEATGFRPRYGLQEALVRTIRAEFDVQPGSPAG